MSKSNGNSQYAFILVFYILSISKWNLFNTIISRLGNFLILYCFKVGTLALHFSQKYELSPSSISPYTKESKHSPRVLFLFFMGKEIAMKDSFLSEQCSQPEPFPINSLANYPSKISFIINS